MATTLTLRNTICRALLSALLTSSLFLATAAHAADIRWRIPSGGTFSSTGSWFGGVVPGADDTARFGLTLQTFPQPIPENYTVNFTNDPTTEGLRIEDDIVTFNLNGHTYSLVRTSAPAQVGNISGANGRLTITNGLVDGFSTIPMFVGLSGGSGELNINSFGRLKSLLGTVGFDSGGAATVSGASSEWVMAQDLHLGLHGGGAGFLNILAGGRVQSQQGTLAGSTASTGTVTISDAGSEWLASDNLAVGFSGTGTVNVLAGGALTTAGGTIATGSTANGTVTIDGAGSSWLNSADLDVGHFGVGTLNITGGGGALNRDTFIGKQPTGSGTVIVEGAGSLWNILGQLNIGTTSALGEAGQGTLRIRPGASVVVTQRTYLGTNDALHLEGGELSTPEVRFSGANKPFLWTSGKLRDVRRFETNMTVPTGGILEPVHATGTTLLTGTQIFGNYDQQAAGSTLAVDIGGASPFAYDRVDVNGAALLGGNLQVTLSSGFTPTDSNSFHILEAIGDITTSFANVANGQRILTTNGLGSFRANYGPASAYGSLAANDIILDLYQPILLPGDYNNNGAVDAADYVIWRKGVGIAPTPESYNLWRVNFGEPSGSGAASALNSTVPEPTTLVLLMCAAAGWCVQRRPAA
jgi:T5SS/PEP-CTERM-associated repeat protein